MACKLILKLALIQKIDLDGDIYFSGLALDQEKPNIIKFGRSRQGRQRDKCTSCGQAFCETTGTLFHGRRTPEPEIIECFALLAQGMRISSISRVKGFKEDMILDWLRASGQHAAAVEEVLLADYRLSRGQLDGLWSYVGHKGEKRVPRERKPRPVLALYHNGQ